MKGNNKAGKYKCTVIYMTKSSFYNVFTLITKLTMYIDWVGTGHGKGDIEAHSHYYIICFTLRSQSNMGHGTGAFLGLFKSLIEFSLHIRRFW